jgi:hypothetical protein
VSEPVPASKQIPASEEVPVEALNTRNEMESLPSCELHWWSLPEDVQNPWQILVFVLSVLFNILISLVIQQLLQRCWHRKDKKEQEPTQGDENFVQQLRTTMTLMQEKQDKQCTRLQNEMESVRDMMKSNERRIAQFQNVKDLVKTVKQGDEHLTQLQNQMGLMEKAMKAEGKHRDQIQKAINSMKQMVERLLSVSTEEMVGNPASMESPVNMRTPTESYTIASNAAAKKTKLSISKIPVSLMPLPNSKEIRSKIGSRDDVGYKAGGSHVKMDAQNLDSSRMQAVHAKLYGKDKRSR